ncbi:MAG: hypothetical protein ACI4MQ_07075 [Candidatus Coproplasma sp.]
MKFSDRVKKFPYLIIGLILILVSSVLVLWMSLKDNSQATASITLKVAFQGEYSLAGGEFKQLEKGEKIPATQGDLTLRGYFELQTEEGEGLGRVSGNCDIAM